MWVPRGEPRLCRLTHSVIARLCLCDCVRFLCVCRAFAPALCLSYLFMLQGLGESGALLDLVTLFPFRPKHRPSSFVLPEELLYTFATYVWVFFNPTFQHHLRQYLLMSQVRHTGCCRHCEGSCSLTCATVTKGNVWLTRKQRGSQWGWECSNNAGANQISCRNEFPVSKHTVKRIQPCRPGEGSLFFSQAERKAGFV